MVRKFPFYKTPLEVRLYFQIFRLLPSSSLQRPRASPAREFPGTSWTLSSSPGLINPEHARLGGAKVERGTVAPEGVSPDSESGRRGSSRHCGQGWAHGGAPAATSAAAASMLQRRTQSFPAGRLPLPEQAAAGSQGPGPALVAAWDLGLKLHA